MGRHGRKSKFSSIWFTQSKIGEYFDLSAREVGQYLIELGLRIYDVQHGEYVPTDKARAEGYCAYTPLKSGAPYFLWHRYKIGELLQEKTGREPWTDLDIDVRGTARDLIAAAREAERGYDKVFYLMYDEIPKKRLSAVMAWAIWLTYRQYPNVHMILRESIAVEEIASVEYELTRILNYRPYTRDDLQQLLPLHHENGETEKELQAEEVQAEKPSITRLLSTENGGLDDRRS